MESLVFVLVLMVVTVAWMGQVTQPRMCVRRVRHHRVLAVLRQKALNTAWRARDAEQSGHQPKRLRSAPQGRTGTRIRGEADHSST